MKLQKDILFVVLILSLTSSAFAQDKNALFVSIHFKREQAIENIRQIEVKINENKSTISQAQNIINIARQKGNTKAEMAAIEALQKTRDTLRKNEESLEKWKIIKNRLDALYASLQNEMFNTKIKGVISDYSGRVEVFKANGEKVSPENGLLEPGDEVWTSDGTANIEMLDGRGNTIVKPWSVFKMKDESKTEEIWELIKGKAHVAVEKIAEHKKEIEDKMLKFWFCSKYSDIPFGVCLKNQLLY